MDEMISVQNKRCISVYKWHILSQIFWISRLYSAWHKYTSCFKERRCVFNFNCVILELATDHVPCLLLFIASAQGGLPSNFRQNIWLTITAKCSLCFCAYCASCIRQDVLILREAFRGPIGIKHGLIPIFLLLRPLFWHT